MPPLFGLVYLQLFAILKCNFKILYVAKFNILEYRQNEVLGRVSNKLFNILTS